MVTFRILTPTPHAVRTIQSHLQNTYKTNLKMVLDIAVITWSVSFNILTTDTPQLIIKSTDCVYGIWQFKGAHTGGKSFFHGPKHHKDNILLISKHSLVILSLICTSYTKEDHGNLVSLFFKRKVRGQRHSRETNKCRKNTPYSTNFIVRKYWQHPVQDNQCPERAGHPRPTLSVSVRYIYTNYIPRYLDI